VLWFAAIRLLRSANQKVTRACWLAGSGSRFGILYEGASNAGTDGRRVGEEGSVR